MPIPFIETTKFIYSASSIKTFQNCPLQFYYHKIKRPKPKVPTLLEFVRGKLLHAMTEKFYKDDGTPKYKSAEAFANTGAGNWKRIISQGEYGGQRIEFKKIKGKASKSLGYAKEKEVREICTQIYKLYSASEPPLEKELRIPFAFISESKIYMILAILDEVRRGLIIRDHKSDYFMPEEGSTSLKHDIQFTTYAAALSFKCSRETEFARRIGVSEEDIAQLANDPLHIMDKIKTEHHHMRTGTMTPTYRTKGDLEEVIDDIDEIEHFTATLDPNTLRDLIVNCSWGKKCDRCIYKKFHEADYEKEKTMGPGYQPILLGVVPQKPTLNLDHLKQLKFRRRRSGGISFLDLPKDIAEVSHK